MENVFRMALDNVARYGDTDIFPFPIEQHVLYDKATDVIKLLMRAEKEFFGIDADESKTQSKVESFLSTYHPVNVSALSPIGYTGFRSATQIDPFWNVYLLAQVLSITDLIEAERLPISCNAVFSYRFKYNTETKLLFDEGIGWKSFLEHSREVAKQYSHMLICDIADFYPRIYHHRIENALLQVAGHSDRPKRIIKLLGAFSDNRSYGLPVGGPAARILAELLLNATDRLMHMNRIRFCRFVDDYHIFANSVEEAYKHLIFLSEKLLVNEGQSLQKSKTRILTTNEFLATSNFLLAGAGDEPDDAEARAFLKVHIKYDPYSADPEGDYEKAQKELGKFNIIGILSRELEKSRIHSALVKQLLKAIKFLDDEIVDTTSRILVDNLGTLAPVFPQCMLVLRNVLTRLSPESQRYVFTALRNLIQKGSHITQVDLNRMYTARVLGGIHTVENKATLVELFNQTSSNPLLRKDIILIMAKWRDYVWISDVIRLFPMLNAWERRACIVASFCLRDEGKHWRHNKKDQFSPFECIVRDWAAEKSQDTSWEIPI